MIASCGIPRDGFKLKDSFHKKFDNSTIDVLENDLGQWSWLQILLPINVGESSWYIQNQHSHWTINSFNRFSRGDKEVLPRESDWFQTIFRIAN